MSVNSKMTAIADAIREKTGGTNPLTLDQMATEIEGIQTGVQLPELDNPGSASDLVSGKQLIDGEGNVVTGSQAVSGGLLLNMGSSGELTYNDNDIVIVKTAATTMGRVLLERGYTITDHIDADRFGNATAADVVAGKTFTSAAGLMVEGTRPEPTTETWVFTLENGSTVTKEVHIE